MWRRLAAADRTRLSPKLNRVTNVVEELISTSSVGKDAGRRRRNHAGWIAESLNAIRSDVVVSDCRTEEVVVRGHDERRRGPLRLGGAAMVSSVPLHRGVPGRRFR